ncbi:DUF262 domain-containing protein [Hymenobacter arizonensis]|uniref:DUF262 domain-containing protein n=1 Tax=Hymenobacter arizonensis TaxID=1227077 RepID=A0A1I5YXA4_HYMAR|nr:DUF262 domain-containing protein [Hymenobacter arizonensis]SFQ48903.1 Protein of unknown function [Hymenobacter arizonensis]
MNSATDFVNAHTCTLLSINNEQRGLFDDQSYVIPVYQRPLAWSEYQIQRLLDGFWTAFQAQEPYFIGTLLLIPRSGSEWEVVDGQQRLTTLLLLCQVAKWQYGEEVLPVELRRQDWLRTQVSSQEQQTWLNEVTANPTLPTRPEGTIQNPYLRNAFFIYDWFEGQETQTDENGLGFEPKAFFDFLMKAIHVVVIKTNSGLAKALDIFNTINTTGLPLTGDDLFKIKLYDYLTQAKGMSDQQKQDVLQEIDGFYANIVARNKANGQDITGPDQILRVYQRILIERAGLSRTLHEWAPDRFYEMVFESVLLNRSQGFDAASIRAALGDNPLQDLNRLVEMRFVWDEGFSPRHDLWYSLQNLTRYGWRFEFLDLIYLFRFYSPDFASIQPKFELWKELMVKYYIVKTLESAKVVNAARTLTYNVIQEILKADSTPDTVLAVVREALRNYNQQWFLNHCLTGDVFENAARRNLTARLSALLMEEPDWKNGWNTAELRARVLGNTQFEVEHIHPRHPSAEFLIAEQWPTEHLNSLGNLTLLEWDVNRLVLNYPLRTKQQIGYHKSDLQEVQQLMQHEEGFWSLEACQQRTQRKAQALHDFIFGEATYSN